MAHRLRFLPVAFVVMFGVWGTSVASVAAPPATPPELVATYDSLADAILATKASERNVVRAILASTHGHAHASYERAKAALAANDTRGAGAAIEDLAAYVGQLATEGDNAVGAVRKKLVEGGHHHHHHAEGAKEPKADEYDKGYVLVDRLSKQRLLDASKAIGRLAAAPSARALDEQWTAVGVVCDKLLR